MADATANNGTVFHTHTLKNGLQIVAQPMPDFLAAGPRDVLVPQTGVPTARDVLLQAELISDQPPTARTVQPGRLLAGLIVALLIGALIIWGLSRLAR